MSKSTGLADKPDYGIDAPAVLRNLFVIGAVLLVLVFVTPQHIRVGPVDLMLHWTFGVTGGFLLAQGFIMLFYVKSGKFRHRDFMLAMHPWRGDEQVLDVGCGRGLLLAGVAKRLTTGHATGLDIWSNVDMGANSEAATLRNLSLEGVETRCTLISAGAQEMPFADASFDVIVSNLCVHNIYDKPTRRKALHEIARVLKPGGVALISDYKLTGEYVSEFMQLGLQTSRRWGPAWTTLPPLGVVVARKS